MNATRLFKTFLVVGLLFVANLSYAPGPPPPPSPGGGHNPVCWPPPCVPIDNGIIFLIIAAGLYGGYMLYRSKKNQKAQA